MLANRRAKIVATIGPATSSHENLELAVKAGMNVARLNFSHGTHEDHKKVIDSLRKISKDLKAPVTLLQDLQGPKMRVGRFKDGGVLLEPGLTVQISPSYEQGIVGKIPTDFKELPEAVRPDDRLLLDDGLMELKVLSVNGDVVEAQVVYGGFLKDRKGMNLPGVPLPVECLTNKDLDDLEFGLSQGVDYVALSFVRQGSDIRKLRSLVEEKRPGTKIIAKIEMLEALENLEEIISLSDGVMVARGDLAIETGQAQLPQVQKRIIEISNRLKKPVITATQMLDSMVENPRPTRAEITDVANAILDGTDALMLSQETASGKFPFKCISTMHDIALEVEKNGRFFYDIRLEDDEASGVPDSIAASACLTAKRLDAAAIICLTTSGKTATLISSFRPKARIIAATSSFDTLNRLEAVWGIQTFSISPYKTTDDAMLQIQSILMDYGLAEKGDYVILTLGMPISGGAKTNTVRVFQLAESRGRASSQIPLRCLKDTQT